MLATYPESDGKPSLAAAVWIDLHNPTKEEVDAVGKELGMDVPEREDLEEIESSSRLQADEDGRLILSLPLIAHEDDDGPTPLGFVLTPSTLLTVHFTKLHTFEMARKALTRHKQDCSSSEIFAMLIDAMIDFAADTLEKTSSELNGVSRQVFRRYSSTRQHNIARSNRRMRETLVSVGACGEQLSQIREVILGMERILPFVADKGKDWIDAKIAAKFKVAGQDLQSLSDFEVHLSNKVQFLLDAVLGFINTEQNDIFKVLTIASVVGIPPTFFASMWGMNFKSIPEYNWAHGYTFGLSVIIISTVLPIAWFKWRGWW